MSANTGSRLIWLGFLLLASFLFLLLLAPLGLILVPLGLVVLGAVLLVTGEGGPDDVPDRVNCSDCGAPSATDADECSYCGQPL